MVSPLMLSYVIYSTLVLLYIILACFCAIFSTIITNNTPIILTITQIFLCVLSSFPAVP